MLTVTIRASENRPCYPSASFVNPSARPEIFLEPSPHLLPWIATLLRRVSSRGNWRLRTTKSRRYSVSRRPGFDVRWIRAEREPEEETEKTDDATVSATDYHSNTCSSGSPVSF